MAPSSSNIDDHRKSSMFLTTTTTTTTTTTATPISSRSASGGTGFVIKNQQLLNYSLPKSKENAHHHHHYHHYVRRLKRLPKFYDYRTSTTNTNTHNNHSNIIGGDGGGRKAALASVLSAAASILMPNISSDHYHQPPHHLHLHQHDVHFHQPSSSSSSSLASSSSNHSVHDHRASKFLLSKISSLMMLTNQSSASSPFLFAANHTGNYSGVSPILLGSSPGIFSDPIRHQLELELEQQQEREQQQQEEEMSFWIKIIFYVIYMLICWLGIFGNMIVCYVVARKPSMHTVTNVFIANLALSDILLCLFAVPFTPLYLITFKSWIFGRALCHLVPFAQGVSVYISAFTLMSIAIDRYFVILHPFKPRMQMRTCLWIVATIWISAMILTFPYAHFMKFTSMSIYDYTNSNSNNSTGDNGESACDDPDVVLAGPEDNNNNINPAHNYTTSSSSNSMDMINLCSEEWPHDEISKMFGITTTILQFVIPFLMITFCYVKICSKLSDRARTIPGNVSARREEQERERTRKTNGMLISMVVIFVISWLPMNMLNLLADFYSEATQWPHHETLFLISHAIAMSSTCYNPFLYAWLNDNFRKEFKEVLPCFGWLNRYFSRMFCRAHDSTTTSCSMANSANQNNNNNNRSSNINININNNGNNHHQNQNQNHNPHPNHDDNNNSNAHHFNDDGDAHHTQQEDETKLCGFEDGNSTTTTNNHNKDNPGQAAASSALAVASSNSSFKRKFMNFRRSSSQQQKKDATNKSKIISMSSFHHHHHQNDNGHKHTTTTDVEEARQSLITKDQIPTRYDGTYMDLGHNNDNNHNNNYRESISIVQNSNTSSSSNSSNATVTTNLHSQLD